MVEQDTEVTKVAFRKFRDGRKKVIALFPEILANFMGDMQSYIHAGQHGAASRDLISVTDGATPEEYADLKEELGSIGYNLEVRQKITRQMDEIRLEQLWSES